MVHLITYRVTVLLNKTHYLWNHSGLKHKRCGIRYILKLICYRSPKNVNSFMCLSVLLITKEDILMSAEKQTVAGTHLLP